jgi:acetyltransferase-like isoleucine patch superfamily enzyme
MKNLKRLLKNSPFLCLLAARVYSRICSIRIFIWRIVCWPRVSIDRSVKVIGWRNISFGRNVAIGARSMLNINHRDHGIKLIFGDNAFIGVDNFFSIGQMIKISEYVNTAPHCAFVGSAHVYSNVDLHYGGSAATNINVIEVGVNCFIGYGATILGNIRIGHGSVIGARSFVRSDIPPFSLAVGNPARVVKYYDFSKMSWENGQRPPSETFPNESDYLAGLRSSVGFPVQPLSVTLRNADV